MTVVIINHYNQLNMRSKNCILTCFTAVALAGAANAGDIYLTGHDVLLHGGQNGYDAVILDYLRGGTEKSDYSISVVGTANTGSGSFSGGGDNLPWLGHAGSISLGGTLAGYSSATFYDAETLASDEGSRVSAFSADALIIMSHTSCGGCSLTTAGSAALNSLASDIAVAFNDGMDIWGNSGASLESYYEFLPASAAASGTSIGGSSGFTATDEGLAIGIESNMINGHPTHNRFPSFAPVFTVMETRGDERISIALRDGTITDGDIVTGPPTVTVPDGGSSLLLLMGGVVGLLGLRRYRN